MPLAAPSPQALVALLRALPLLASYSQPGTAIRETLAAAGLLLCFNAEKRPQPPAELS